MLKHYLLRFLSIAIASRLGLAPFQLFPLAYDPVRSIIWSQNSYHFSWNRANWWCTDKSQKFFHRRLPWKSRPECQPPTMSTLLQPRRLRSNDNEKLWKWCNNIVSYEFLWIHTTWFIVSWMLTTAWCLVVHLVELSGYLVVMQTYLYYFPLSLHRIQLKYSEWQLCRPRVCPEEQWQFQTMKTGQHQMSLRCTTRPPDATGLTHTHNDQIKPISIAWQICRS